MNVVDLLKYETARSGAYKGLAGCYRMPNNGLHNDLVQLEHYLDTLGSEAATHITRMRSGWLGRGNEIDDLCVDFARLFVGPYALLAPPYGSVYLDGERKVMGDSTIDVCMRYAEVGLELADHFKEVPDHIAAELEFMYFLILKEAEAISHSDFEQALDFLKKQEEFLSSHLGVWVSEFADHVERNAETQFYKQLARTTKVFVSKDLMENLAESMRLIDNWSTVSAKHGRLEAESGVQ
ncbi:MAG: molecular chaperone TorD family protein [Desulfobacteria bacterium]